jgi:hypothetical protein
MSPMNTTLFIEILAYTIPAVIGVVVIYLFNAHFKDQQNTLVNSKENQKTALPYDCRLMSV